MIYTQAIDRYFDRFKIIEVYQNGDVDKIINKEAQHQNKNLETNLFRKRLTIPFLDTFVLCV